MGGSDLITRVQTLREERAGHPADCDGPTCVMLRRIAELERERDAYKLRVEGLEIVKKELGQKVADAEWMQDNPPSKVWKHREIWRWQQAPGTPLLSGPTRWEVIRAAREGASG